MSRGVEGRLIDVHVDRMSYGEEAVGRHEGKVVFCFGAVPGELVRARVYDERPRFARAIVEEVLEPSVERVIPPCPYFGTCGGCHWQQIAYGEQVRQKTAVVRDQLARLGGVSAELVRDTIPSPVPYRYRNAARFGVTMDAEAWLGFRRLRSRDLVRIDHCFLLPMSCNRALFRLQELLYEKGSAGLREVTLRVGGEESGVVALLSCATECGSLAEELVRTIPEVRGVAVSVGGDAAQELGRTSLREALSGVVYGFSPTVFFQVNLRQAERLLQIVDGSLPLSGSDVVLDAYSGSGLFSLLAARTASRVIAIEANAAAVADAVQNASARRLTNIDFHVAPVERLLPALKEPFSVAILDPPRSGCRPAVLQALIARRPRTIVYVSCSPPTLARDTRTLFDGGYRVESVRPLDMFPQTYHVELVTALHSA